MRSLLLLAFASAACSSDTVSNAEQAQRAYFGLDRAIDKELNLGLKGYNETSSANIPTEMDVGDVAGTLTVTGQVSHGTGSSGNAEMRLATALAAYQDRLATGDAPMPSNITYDTDAAALPELDLSLRNIPSGTFTGTLAGKVHMSGDLKGDVTLALTFTGNLEPVPGMAGKIERTPGTTHVTGTATSDYGTFAVDVTR